MSAMHIAVIRSLQNGKLYHSKLLRRSFRDDQGRVQKKTLANLSHLPDAAIDLLKAHLAGRTLVDPSEAFDILRSRAHGSVLAVRAAFRRLDLARLVASQPSPQRDLVCAMIAARILRPQTKLATARWWHATTLPARFDLRDASAEDLYAAMDWLLKRQQRIQAKLARRHFAEGGLVLLDLSSAYFEGSACPLARYGHNRDGKQGKLQVNFGLLCDRHGRPVAINVFEGNVGDPRTVLPAVRQLRRRFGLSRVVLVGDRGMLVQARLAELRKLDGIDWITALRSGAIRKLERAGRLEHSDEVGLFEIVQHPDYPGERLVACRNPRLAAQRAHTRESLLQATEQLLAPIRASVAAGRLQGAAQIGLRVGAVLNRYKVRKHFVCEIGEARFDYRRDQHRIDHETALDGVYVIRTSLAAQQLPAAECVRSYKALTRVERAFRTLKTADLQVRPVHHRLADRVRAHLFLCLLAYYVEWHMREAWRPLLYADDELAERARTRDPVAPAEPSASAQRQKATRRAADGTPLHSFRTLLEDLARVVRNDCRAKGEQGPQPCEFELDTQLNAEQARALELLKGIQIETRT